MAVRVLVRALNLFGFNFISHVLNQLDAASRLLCKTPVSLLLMEKFAAVPISRLLSTAMH